VLPGVSKPPRPPREARSVGGDCLTATSPPGGRDARSWCANTHLRKLAELERFALLRAQAEEERAVNEHRRNVEHEQIREAWSERRA
jgi:hypothetical protein